jgi:hypothetical protein
MIQHAEPITLSFTRDAALELVHLSDEMTDRLHELLERNTDGALTSQEQAELTRLVNMAQFSQLVSTALAAAGTP